MIVQNILTFRHSLEGRPNGYIGLQCGLKCQLNGMLYGAGQLKLAPVLSIAIMATNYEY